MGYLFCNFFGSGIIINGGIPGGAFMNLKLIVAILVITTMPAYAQPKKPSATPKRYERDDGRAKGCQDYQRRQG